MGTIKALLAMLVLVPLLASQAEPGPTADGVVHPEAARMTGQASYECCWVFLNGRWYCIPC